MTASVLLPPYRFTVADYHRMAEAGILTEDDRVELIEGEIVQMSPIGSGHSGTVNALNHLLVKRVGDEAIVAVQNPVRLGDYSEPQPDFALLRPREDSYRSATPVAEDVFVLIEIADSSLISDRKVKVPLYARHGVPEVWIVNLRDGEVEVHSAPGADGYSSVVAKRYGEVLELESVPGLRLEVSEILGS